MSSYTEIVNRTFRRGGVVGGYNAKLPYIVRNYILTLPGMIYPSILDFGSGPVNSPEEYDRLNCLTKYYTVNCYDIGKNVGRMNIPNIHHCQWQIVYASNVLNVQPTKKDLTATITTIYHATASGGCAFVNLPASPRKDAFLGLTTRQGADLVEQIAKVHFSSVERIDGTPSAPILLLKK